MSIHPVLRGLASLAFGLTLAASSGLARPAAALSVARSSSPLAEAPPDSPFSAVPMAAMTPLGWGAIERRVSRGVRQGVASFRFGDADREDVIAIAMERAWRAFGETAEPIRSPEAWGRTIAARVGLDELRRQKRERLWLAALDDVESVGVPHLDEHLVAGRSSPFEAAASAERRTLVRERVQAWPPTERDLAQILLDGHADTVTAAAWLYRERQEASGEPVTMYPQKARVLLDARRGELEDLA